MHVYVVGFCVAVVVFVFFFQKKLALTCFSSHSKNCFMRLARRIICTKTCFFGIQNVSLFPGPKLINKTYQKITNKAEAEYTRVNTHICVLHRIRILLSLIFFCTYARTYRTLVHGYLKKTFTLFMSHNIYALY